MKKTSVILLFGYVLLSFSACVSVQRSLEPTSFRQQYTPMEDEVITQSLFDSKDRTLSEKDVQRLLDGKILLQDSLRIAIFNVSSQSLQRYYPYHWHSEAYLKTQQSYITALTNRLSKAKKIDKVLLMPNLLVSKTKPNLTNLREATVRLQADMLLILSIHSNIYHKYRMFKKDEVKAFATCEALLMDIRTGVIPFSTIVSQDTQLIKEKEDFTTEELHKRAETQASLQVLTKIAEEIVDFLK